MKKRCLFVIQNLTKSGSPLTFLHLIKSILSDFDIDVCVTSALNPDVDLVYLDEYKKTVNKVHLLKIETHKIINRLFPYHCYRQVIKLLNKEKYDVVVSNAFEVASLIDYKKVDVKNVFYSLDKLLVNSKYKIVNIRKRKMLSRIANVDLFIALTNSCFVEGVNSKSKNAIILTDYVDIPILIGEKHFSESILKIGTIGYFSEKKNQIYSLQIIKKLLSCGIDCKLFLMGFYFPNFPEYFNSMIKYINSNNLMDKVVFIDKDYDKIAFFNEIDVMVAPSLYEGLGLVALESQYRLTPCILSDNFPKEAQIGLASFISLEDEKAWIDGVVNAKGKKPKKPILTNLLKEEFDSKARKAFKKLINQ